jgi:hypothetical protein
MTRVLDCATDGEHQLQALAASEAPLIVIAGDRHSADEFHDEVRPPWIA